MLGRNHGSIGLATYGVVLAVAAAHGAPPLSLPQEVVGGLTAVGASLAPDLDEDESTPGRAVPISAVLPIFGGHRTRTHTLAAVVLVAILAWVDVALHYRMVTAVTVGVACAMGAAWAFSGVRQAGVVGGVLVGVAAGWVDYHWVTTGWWLLAALPLPYLSHLLADAMTKGGVPFLMPMSDRRFALGLFRVGHWFEKVVVTPLATLAAALAVWMAVRPSLAVSPLLVWHWHL